MTLNDRRHLGAPGGVPSSRRGEGGWPHVVLAEAGAPGAARRCARPVGRVPPGLATCATWDSVAQGASLPRSTQDGRGPRLALVPATAPLARAGPGSRPERWPRGPRLALRPWALLTQKRKTSKYKSIGFWTGNGAWRSGYAGVRVCAWPAKSLQTCCSFRLSVCVQRRVNSHRV